MSIVIGWPEGIYLALGVLGSVHIASGRAERPTALSIALWVFVTLPLLWWGGFFS